MEIKGKVEAIIYAAEEPVSVEQIALLLKDSVAAGEMSSPTQSGPDVHAQVKAEVRQAIEQLVAEYTANERGIEIRPVAESTPWNPAITATSLPPKLLFNRAPSIFSIRAEPCASSVSIGICQPCQERAGTPIS